MSYSPEFGNHNGLTSPVEIMEILEALKIWSLVHFTRLSNLEGILLRGLTPRKVLEEQKIPFGKSDSLRLDGLDGFNCLTIEQPNRPMFKAVRNRNPNTEWIVLEFLAHPILAHRHTLFSPTNAASKRAKGSILPGIKGLIGMFGHRGGVVSWRPADLQAEILTPVIISRDLIRRVHVRHSDVQNTIRARIPKPPPMEVSPNLFE